MFEKILRTEFRFHRNKKNTRRSKSSFRLSYKNLELRLALAGIFHDAATSTVTIVGDSGNDSGRFFQRDPNTYRATLAGFGGQDFDVSEVNEVVFIGLDGDDFFNNLTDVNAQLLGGNGSDILRGGSGDDFINGGAGDNNMFGNDGNDKIIGLAGNDRITGGGGNDKIFAQDGTNQIWGNDGDDLIFGGADVDTIFGGAGIDQIFALGGDDILASGDGGIIGSQGTAQADLILGHDGNDRFIGGGGLNVFYGGNGDDTFTGGDDENRMHGQFGNDVMTGGSGADYLAGHVGDDTINGLGGNDYIRPGQGNDNINAGTGTDFVAYLLTSDQYYNAGTGPSLEVVHLPGSDGQDTVASVENLQFSDVSVTVGLQRQVVVQPIILSNNNGTNRAEFFGNSSQESQIKQDIDQIFAVGDVDVQWLATKNWNNTFANIGDGGERPRSDLGTVVRSGDSAGVGSSDPLVIDMYFVEVAAGFDDVGNYAVNGLAYVGANGIMMHTGDYLPGLSVGRPIVARVAAHEIAHNLGLGHVHDPNNLMDEGRDLTYDQIFTIQESQFTVPV